MKQPVKILFVLFLFLLTPINTKASEISVTNPWIREAPPNTQMLAAYMEIINNSKHTIQLESAASADFEMVMIHRTETHEGMSHMAKQSGLQIKSGENVILEPGGYHLMLMNPKRNLQAGDKIKLQLQFDNREAIAVTAVVRKK